MAIDGRSVFLVGFMASGKTTVGRELAARLGRPFYDTDRLVEQREGRPIQRIFEVSGEGWFRKAEWEALKTLGRCSACVAATGGGLFLGTMQRAWLRENGRTVWLDVTYEAAASRAERGPPRPLWAEDPTVFRAFFEKRRAAYALADLRVETSEATPAEVAEAILKRLRIGGAPR